jgi:hypothetical protein
MMKKYALFLIMSSFLSAQVYVPGSHNDWELGHSGQATLKSNLGITNYYGITIQAVQGGEFKIAKTNWDTLWSGGYWIPGTGHLNSRWTIAYGGSNAQWNGDNIAELLSYVHLNIEEPANYINTNLPVSIMTLSEMPAAIDSVTIPGVWNADSSRFIATLDSQLVTVTISDALAAEEKLYLRYTTDNWTSDHFIRLETTGSLTSYSGKIPGPLPRNTHVKYYALTTTLEWSANNDLDNHTDLMTIAYANKNGDNYHYSVEGNNPPKIENTTTAYTIEEDSTFQILLTATDLDSDPLTWSSENLPSGASFTDHNDGTATFSWRPSLTQNGNYSAIRFIVSDGQATKAVKTTVRR